MKPILIPLIAQLCTCHIGRYDKTCPHTSPQEIEWYEHEEKMKRLLQLEREAEIRRAHE